MAARNIGRNSRRAAATALALTIGLTVVAAVAVTAASLKDSVADAVSGGNRSDLILEPAGAGIGISPSVADLLRARDDVDGRRRAARVRRRRWTATTALVTGHGHRRARPRDRPRRRERQSRRPRTRHACWSAPTQADDLGVGTGDTVTVTFPETRPARPCEVAGTFSKGSLINASYVDVDARLRGQRHLPARRARS